MWARPFAQSLGMPMSRFFVLSIVLLGAETAFSQTATFPYIPCASSKGRYSVSPAITNPAPHTYCFTVLAGDCQETSSSCCPKADVARFLLDAKPSCDGVVITATFDTRRIPGVAMIRPAKASNTSHVLSVPGLHLNATTIREGGSQVCITLPSSGKCSTLDALIKGSTGRWSAALLSSDTQCCPVSKGSTTPPAPPKGACQSCMVYDVLGPDGTPASAKYDFFSSNSCMLPEVSPDKAQNYTNCCDFFGFWAANDFIRARGPNGILSGFDRPVCNRTSLRLCGTFASAASAQDLLDYENDYKLYLSLPFAFDITDDTSPMSLFDSTIRQYTVKPGSDEMDAKCFPYNETWEVGAVPSREDIYPSMPELVHFPNDTCDSNPGVTPFTVDPYLDIIWGNKWGNATNLYCVNINVTKPVNTSSPCAKSTAISRVSLWLYDDRKEDYAGVYLLTKKTNSSSSSYNKKKLTVKWGPDGSNALFVSTPGLDVATVPSLQPKVCVETKEYPIWLNTVDGMGYVWTSLYDNSGKCCPTYYANRF